MLFNSHVFLAAFLPAALLAWWLLPGTTLRLAALTIASYGFYAYAEPRYVVLLIGVTVIDYAAGRVLARTTRKTAVVWATVIANLGLLAVFKYAGFVTRSIDDAARSLGLSAHLVPTVEILLPIGISFYTLNALSYVIDVCRGTIAAERRFLPFAAFVSMFPHLIAGPIVRYADIGPQLRALRPRLTAEAAGIALTLLAVGLVKKLVIADTLGHHVDDIYQRTDWDLLTAWAGALGFTLQLYFDFSGYSDMAIGLALLLGIRFPLNFDAPLRARDIGEFWRRWHITLGAWMRDYLYTPLGGSRVSPPRHVRNLLITFLIVGLWHGAAWTFVAWGAYNGILVAAHARRSRATARRLPKLLACGVTFTSVVVGFTVFRAVSLEQAGSVLSGMAGLNGLTLAPPLDVAYAVELALAVLAVALAPARWKERIAMTRHPSAAVAIGIAAAIAIMLIPQTTPFLYFKF